MKTIECGRSFICFIDDQHQLYWSPSPEENENIVHFQSLFDNKYENMQIKQVSFEHDVHYTEFELSILELDNNQSIYMFDSNQDVNIEDKLTEIKLDSTIDKGDKIMNIYWQYDGKQVLFVKKKINIDSV